MRVSARCSKSEKTVGYKEILASYEAGEIDFMSALELADCDSLIELYEGVADEEELALIKRSAAVFYNAA